MDKSLKERRKEKRIIAYDKIKIATSEAKVIPGTVINSSDQGLMIRINREHEYAIENKRIIQAFYKHDTFSYKIMDTNSKNGWLFLSVKLIK